MKKFILSFAVLFLAVVCPAQEIDVTGKNVSIPSGSAVYTPKRNTFFGYQVSSQGSITKTFTIKNYGYSNLTVGVVTATGMFTVSAQPVSPVAPGGFTTFTVTYDPSTNTTHTGTITIPNNDANEGTYTFGVQGVGLDVATQRRVRWVNNTGLPQPATVVLQGVTYNVIGPVYTTVQTAINAATQYDIVYITDGRYFNPREAISTNCSFVGLGADPLLYDSIQNKQNIIITSQTGDHTTSNARLVGWGFNLKGGNDITIQGLDIDSCRVNAFWNSNCCTYDPTIDVKILNNSINGTHGHGIKTDYWANGQGFVIDRGAWEINGNTFANIGYYNGYFNNCTPSPVSAMWLGEAGGCFQIDGNTITNVRWAAVLCNGYGDRSIPANGAVTISNNTINGTINAGIQLGWNYGGNGYIPANSYVTGNYIQNANTSNAAGIGAVVIHISYVGNTNILRNHITSSYNGVAINIAGWNNSMAADTARIQYNNFCGLTTGSSAITHIGNQNGNGFFGTGDNLGKYKCDNNYFGSASGPTYYLNPGGIGWELKEETTLIGAGPATYSIGDFAFLPFRTIPYPNPLVPACQCEPNTSNSIVTACGSYLWNSVNYTTSGTYSHSMPNAGVGGCDSVAYLVLTISNPVVTALSQTNVSCFGGTNGAAAVNAATGGIAPYTYNWTPGNPTGDGTTSVTGLSAGTWTCTATDAAGCPATQTFNITSPPAIVITPASQTNVSCFGGTNGAASINTPTGGAGGYTYNWTPGNPTGDGTVSVTGLSAQVYTVTVTDANSCTATQTFNITAPSVLVVTPASQTNVSCFGGSNGAASINTPSGGAGGYSYNWTPGNPTGDGTISVTGLSAQVYTVTVTDANSCTATQTFNLTAPSALVVTPASQTNVSCFGGTNGAASINTPTGGAGGYSYNWTPGNPTGDGTISVTGLSAQVYTVTVTDANSCTATQTFNLTSPTALVVTPATQTNVSCFGGTNGAASINTPTGGAGGYTYNWTPGNPTGDGTISVTGLTAQVYTVTVTDVNSCTATQTFNLTSPTALVATPVSQTNVSCFGGSNGAASVSVSGGTTSYSYNWTPGNPTGDGTASVTGLTAQVYTVTVTDANSCVTTQTFNLTSPSALIVTPASQTNVSCFGGTNGAASINTPTGGAGGYTYDWTPGNPTGDGTTSVTGLTAATWTCTVTDVFGCTATQTFNITAPPALVITPASQTNVSCFGGSNGAASINTPTGGAGGYTYNWTPGNPTGDGTISVTGLTAQVYTVTVTDANSCTTTQTFNLTSPTALVATPASQTNVSCFGGSNGAASVSVSGGTTTYSYNWTPGNPTGDGTASVTGLTAQVYTVTVTDANSCTTTQTFNITAPTAIVVTPASQTNVSCFGGTNGAASINTPTGGAGGYTYNWTPGNPTGDGTVSVTGLTAQVYTVTVTDANTCTATQTFNLTSPTALVATPASQTDVSCFGGSNGAASVSVSGGTTAYTYDWTPGTPTGDGTASVTGLTAQVYTVTVTDANSCVTTQTFNLTSPTALVATPASQTNVSCNGGSNGAATVSVSGGTTSYTYDWTPGTPTGDGTASVTGLTAQVYTVTVTDANSCVTTQTFNLTSPTALVATPASQTNVSCFGGSNGAASVSVSGGTTAYTYDWTPGTPTGDGTASVTGLTAQVYTVTITDANSCVTTQTFNLTSPTALVATPASQTNVSCFGGSNGAASVTVSGGTTAYAYDWTPGTPTGDGTASVTGLTAQVYTVTVTDANSCVTTQTFNLTSPTALVATPASQTDVSCFGGSNGAASVSVSGGTTAYTYDWTPGTPTGDGTASVTGLTAQVYTVTVTDANSCVTTQTFNLTSPTALVATPASQTNVSCNGGSNGAATVSVSGGTTSYTYDWTPGTPTGDGTASVTGLNIGVWTCTVTDANLCVTTQTFDITEPTAIVSSVTTQTNITCNAGNDGAATISASGGTGVLTYNWTPSGGTAPTATGLTAGIYTCTITDANSCSTTQTVNITEPSAIAITTVTVTPSTCGNPDGSGTVSASGGTGVLTYSWAPTGGNAATATGLLAGVYTVTVTDASGCTNTELVSINNAGAATVTLVSQTNVSCNGGSDGAATINAVGGTGVLTYDWTPGSPSGDGTVTATGLTAGLWSCTVTDQNGCISSQTVTITEPPAITVFTSAQTNVSCNGGNNGSATVSASGGTGTLSYAWSSGSNTDTETNLAMGTYTVTITDQNGCSITTTVAITEPSVLSVAATSTPVLCNGGNSTVTVSAAGGTAPYTGEGTFTVVAGTQTYTITDANGCVSTTTITITEPSAIVTTATWTDVLCNGDSTGSIDLTITGGTGPYTVDWNSGMYTTEDLVNIPAGVYAGVLTDANGCTDGGTITITEPPVLAATVTSVTDPSACSATDGAIDITVTGGTIGYSYLWSTTAVTEDVTGLAAGAYSCTVTDTNGCTTTVSANLNDPNAPTVTLTLAMDTICFDDAAFTLSGESPNGGTFSGPGVSAGTFDPATAGVGMHQISYTFTDLNGCTGSTSDSIYVDICLDVNMITVTDAFIVYPNPNNGTFTLQLINATTADVLVFDAQGKLVSTQQILSSSQQIKVGESGIYLITVITSDGQRTTQRVIVTE